MSASSNDTFRPIRRALSTATPLGALPALAISSTAGASSRVVVATTTTSPGSGGVLLILGGAVLVLGGIGFVVFTWISRKRRPNQCTEQREALELAERAVRYWEGARAHLEAVAEGRSPEDDAHDSTHASLVAKAAAGLRDAVIQRDQCQMDLIRCMASGVPAVPVITPAPLEPWPFSAPGPDETSPS